MFVSSSSSLNSLTSCTASAGAGLAMAHTSCVATPLIMVASTQNGSADIGTVAGLALAAFSVSASAALWSYLREHQACMRERLLSVVGLTLACVTPVHTHAAHIRDMFEFSQNAQALNMSFAEYARFCSQGGITIPQGSKPE